MSDRIPVAVLAATGSVGQRFIQLLDCHPYFKVVAVTASDRTVGKTYGEACHWILPGDMPSWAREMVILPTAPESASVPLVFSALPADAAMDVEPAFAKAGSMVCSNASSYRMAPDVSILLPEVNPDQTDILPIQRKLRGWSGGIITNSNCTSTGVTVALKALQDAFGLKKVFAVSMQALSGAGYPGIPSVDIIDNVIPLIKGEEEKVESEPRKMLGKVVGQEIVSADFAISAHTNRVAVVDGHMVCISVELDKKASPEEAIAALRSYQAPEISRDLPSAPKPVIVVRTEADRPQPRLDRLTGKGMATVVGRVRKDPLFDLKMVVLSHNTIRGAAGGSIYNAELLVKQGYVTK
ncbi:MAG: aspartate-semialdehyde dehydrogenase [Anaerolineaceae bacterium]|nr:aspartate-semialdehyde dehydrogenase [Anaerolineaceae bacterium]